MISLEWADSVLRKTAEKIVSEVVEAVKEWREIAIRQCGRGVLSFRECRTVR